MSNSNELPLGQKRLLEKLEQTQEKIYAVVDTCIEKLSSGEDTDLETIREALLQQPQNLDESQRRLLGASLNELLALRYQQQDFVRQIDEYVARTGLPGLPNPQPLPKYGCPRCSYIKYQLSPQQSIGSCPEHRIQLVRKP